MATQEQSSGIDQINLAVSQMDTVTQQNAALVEEAAAAAASLQEQAAGLAEAVSIFRMAPSALPAAQPMARRMTATAPQRRPALAAAPAKDDWEEF